jgi:hypothetical protein
MSAAAYKKLLRQAARAFYGGPCPPKDQDTEGARSKLGKVAGSAGARRAPGGGPHAGSWFRPAACMGRMGAPHGPAPQHPFRAPPAPPPPGPQVNTTGIAWVVVDYMVEQEWVNETALFDTINANPKLLRKVLKYLEKVCRCWGIDAGG